MIFSQGLVRLHYFCKIIQNFSQKQAKLEVEKNPKSRFFLGNIHVLRKHKGGREGVSQMLTFAYEGGGGLRGHAYLIIVWKKC